MTFVLKIPPWALKIILALVLALTVGAAFLARGPASLAWAGAGPVVHGPGSLLVIGGFILGLVAAWAIYHIRDGLDSGVDNPQRYRMINFVLVASAVPLIALIILLAPAQFKPRQALLTFVLAAAALMSLSGAIHRFLTGESLQVESHWGGIGGGFGGGLGGWRVTPATSFSMLAALFLAGTVGAIVWTDPPPKADTHPAVRPADSARPVPANVRLTIETTAPAPVVNAAR